VNFVTTNVYALVRHPACTFMYMAFWITPTMVWHVKLNLALNHSLSSGTIGLLVCVPHG